MGCSSIGRRCPAAKPSAERQCGRDISIGGGSAPTGNPTRAEREKLSNRSPDGCRDDETVPAWKAAIRLRQTQRQWMSATGSRTNPPLSVVLATVESDTSLSIGHREGTRRLSAFCGRRPPSLERPGGMASSRCWLRGSKTRPVRRSESRPPGGVFILCVCPGDSKTDPLSFFLMTASRRQPASPPPSPGRPVAD